jgi:hypothetical protein
MKYHNFFPWGKLGLNEWIDCNHNQKRPQAQHVRKL